MGEKDSPKEKGSLVFDPQVVLVDANNLAHRYWWSHKQLRTSSGEPSGLEFGFISGVLNLIRNYPQSRIILAWDGVPAVGKKLFAGYKANREAKKDRIDEPPWGPRLVLLRETMSSFLPTLYSAEVEADTQIAAWIRWERVGTDTVLIVSTDKDFHQLVSETVFCLGLTKNGLFDLAKVREKWGVTGRNLLVYRSLDSDVSDGLPGISRLPSKVILNIARECTEVPDAERLAFFGETPQQKIKLRSFWEQMQINYQVMDLLGVTDRPEYYGEVTGDRSKLEEMCSRLEMQSIKIRREWDLALRNSLK